MNKTQTVLLGLLKDFDNICRKGGISYYLIDRVLLGAVSIGGFLERGMRAGVLVMQNEFDTLNEIMKAETPKERIWMTKEDEPAQLISAARLYDTKSANLCRETLGTDTPGGHFISIYTLVPYPAEDGQEKYLASTGYGSFVINKEWLEPHRILKFEGAKFNGPAEPLKVLDAEYGYNWNLYYKSTEHRLFQRNAFPYSKYSEELNKLCESSGYRSLLDENTEDIKAKDRVEKELKDLKQIIRKIYLTTLVSRLEKSIGWEGRDWPEEADALMEELIDRILDREFINCGQPVTISNDLCVRIFETLIRTDRIDDADYFADMYSDYADYGRFKEDCRIIRDIKALAYDGKIDKAKALLSDITERYGIRTDAMMDGLKELDYILESKFTPEDGIRYKKVLASKDIMLTAELRRKGFFNGAPIETDTIEVLELLREFDNICTELKLDYVTFSLPSSMFRNERFYNLKTAIVLMKPGAMLKFLDYINKTAPGNRIIEYYGNNPEYPFFTMRYVDRSSLCYNAGDPGMYKMNGFCIEIVPVRDRKLKKTKLDFMIEKAQRQHDRYSEGFVVHNMSGLERLAMKVLKNYLPGKDDSARDRFFRQLCRDYDNGGKEGWILTRKEQFRKVPGKVTSDTQKVVLFSRYTYRISNNLEKIFNIYKDFTHDLAFSADSITSDVIGYEEFITRLNNKEEIEKTIDKNKKTYDRLTAALEDRMVMTEQVWEEISKLYTDPEEEE